MDKNNMSIEDASEFWDEHDFTEFSDITEVNNIRFNLKRRKYIGLPSDLYNKIQEKAKKIKKNPENLIIDWLKEKAI